MLTSRMVALVAGLIVGLIAWWLPGAAGGGHAVAESALGGTMRISLAGVMILLVAKFVATALSYGSGAPGGIFAPMLLLGALVGTAIARIGANFVPSNHLPLVYAVVAAAAACPAKRTRQRKTSRMSIGRTIRSRVRRQPA